MLVARYTLPWPSKASRVTSALFSSSPPTRVNVLPPSPERSTPMPAYESELVFASPVPTHRASSAGLTWRAPMDRVGASSSRGSHDVPPSVDFHTPPSAAPRYRVVPSAASAVARPLTRPEPPPELEKVGSRYPCASLSYRCVVTSPHAPPDTGRALAAAYAPVNAPASTVSAGAVRAAANWFALSSASNWPCPASVSARSSERPDGVFAAAAGSV